MKNFKYNLLKIACLIFVSIVVCACKTTKDAPYSGDFWKKHYKHWKIQVWDLENWNEQKYSMQYKDILGKWNEQTYFMQDEDTLEWGPELKTVLKDTIISNEVMVSKAPLVSLEEEPETMKQSLIITVVKGDEQFLSEKALSEFVAKETFVAEKIKIVSYYTYDVIVGCYKDKARALLHLKKVKLEGYAGSKIMVSKYGLNRVSIKEFLDKELACKFADDYRSVRPDVWVYLSKVTP